ncbi:MAG: hypothetical protein CK426_01755 [Legionella sp.]|nr:MAG: hypothetical protein CK423_00085 [Legionella sp.]PJD99533.1 MAG: hypothetical protein CK426_01755 [Legionella sp.]
MNRYRGFSLIEIMVGLSVGLIVIASVGALFVSTLHTNIENVKLQRFEKTIQILKSTMTSQIRRAGFSNALTSLPDVTGWASGSHYYTNGSCALFTYVDTTLVPPKQQFFGYKLDTNTGILYFYQTDNLVSCSTTGTWTALNDPTQIKFYQTATDSFFSSPVNPSLIQIHFIAEDLELTVEGAPVRREIELQVFIRNS